VGGQRLIFKFSDEELQNILRYKIVFCTKDEILLQFIATCLRIDKLEDSLFTLATPETLGSAKDIDILFYGPGYTPADFEGRVKEGRMVQFADEAFEKRLLENERLKAKTKQSLLKVEKAMLERKAQMEQVTKEAKAHREKLRALSTTVAGMKEERNKLKERVDHNAQRKHHYQGELELLESKLANIDAKFQGIKERITNLMNAGPEQTEEKVRLVEELRNELMALNKDLARLMFVKGVKDVGDFVSKTTQNQIAQRIDQKERFDTSKPLPKIAVADDGSNIGQTLKRIFTHVGSTYLRVPEQAVEQLTLKRLAGRLETEKDAPSYPFVALFADQPQDSFEELRMLVRKIHAKMPDAYQLVLCNMGDITRLPSNSPALGNILAIKERAALVNAWIVDYSEPKAMLKLLQEKAPRG
jgi:type II secretory pathway component PulJ